MRKVFLGSEALEQKALTAYELRRWHRPLLRDVYCAKEHEVSLRDRIEGAWLRSGRMTLPMKSSLLVYTRDATEFPTISQVASSAKASYGLPVLPAHRSNPAPTFSRLRDSVSS